MKFKWRYTMVPACISFGPLMASNMGGLGTGWVTPMLGSIMLTVGLGMMLDIIVKQQLALNGLLEQHDQKSITSAQSPTPSI
jgi:hypothetical protein